MKRPKEEYDHAIAILEDNTYIHPPTLVPAIDAMRELRDSAFALEEALSMIGELRPAVLAFALKMEEVLRANDHKGHWKDCLSAYLFSRLQEEVVELLDAWEENNPETILKEAADVGNFAMMIADNMGHLERSTIARWAASAPAPAPPLSPHQSEKIMDDASPNKITGPSSDPPDAGNSTPGV